MRQEQRTRIAVTLSSGVVVEYLVSTKWETKEILDAFAEKTALRTPELRIDFSNPYIVSVQCTYVSVMVN